MNVQPFLLATSIILAHFPELIYYLTPVLSVFMMASPFLLTFYPAFASYLPPYLLVIPMLRTYEEFLWHKNFLFEN